jgi:hypothetical protein
MLRNSERSTFKKCRFLWDISYNRRLAPNVSQPALRFGTLVHSALALHYPVGKKRGKNPVTEFERLYQADLEESYEFGWRDEDGRWNDAGELGVAMLTGYLGEYGNDDRWEVLVTEHPYRVVVMHPLCGICQQEIYEGDCDAQCSGPKYVPWFAQTGVLDGVWKKLDEKRDYNIIVDHKTAKAISTRHLVMDDQAGSYWTWGYDSMIAEGLLKANVKLRGMMFNFLRKAIPDERPRNEAGHYLNKDGSVSKKQPSALFLRHYTFRDEFDRQEQRRRAMGEYKEIEMIRAGKLAISKSPGQMTCSGCWLLDACELHEVNGDWEEFLRQTTRLWNPYDAQEVMMGR